MIVAGVMSGTSADGIDVTLVRLRDGQGAWPKLTLLAHEAFPYPAGLRRAVLKAMNAKATSTAELARLNWRLGMAYAEAVKETVRRHPMKLALVGVHGQTVYHQPRREAYAGERFACTWQLGEMAIVAGELGVPVVSNFRPADMVAGGQGAPLVPLLDFALFRHETRGRVLQNIGGIANFSAIPAGAGADGVLAFDTGPGNMVMDWLMTKLYGRAMDEGGVVAASGRVLTGVLERELRLAYFEREPPKTAGREQFGREYSARFLAACRRASSRAEDAVATAAALTVESIVQAYARFAVGRMGGASLGKTGVDFVVSGGGARNGTLMRLLAERLKAQGCRVKSIDAMAKGMPAEAKEAAAFALLAWQTWHRRAGNLPSATGATRGAILGQVTYV